jgi:hypothetical protein
LHCVSKALPRKSVGKPRGTAAFWHARRRQRA